MDKKSKDILLEMKDISKSFPGVKALDGAQLTLRAGEVHALMGENGAGKSTLMKCLFGVYRIDEGKILLGGKEVLFKNPKAALDGGVAMVHQELNQALKLSVNDNMWLGRFPKAASLLPFIKEGQMRKMTLDVFKKLGISFDPDTKMERLSVSERQMVEIAKAVSYGANVIVFDEPTSSLNDSEAEKLFSIIRMLKKDGCGIIYISHKMSEILRISDTVTVMRDGKHISTEAAKNITTEKIIKLMVGRDISDRYPRRKIDIGEILFEAENLVGEYSRLKSASLSLRKGEILGVAGLDGSGRTELLEAIFGLAKRRCGTMRLLGNEIKNKSPKEAKANGFALLTEERRATGIFGILSVRENTIAASLEKHRGPLLLLSKNKMSASTKECIRSMRIKTPTQMTKIRNLSGGNQQKVILGRWLLTKPLVLLLDEPTRGVDVGAKYEIYSLITSLADEGRGVIVVSSEMPELLGLCDRIIVMSDGKVSGELNKSEATQERIMELATKNL